MKQQNKSCGQLDIETLAQDQDLVRQIQKSRADRRNGRMYNKEQGLAYLRSQVDAFECGWNLK